jgi:hypothetical protein
MSDHSDALSLATISPPPTMVPDGLNSYEIDHRQIH